MLLKVIKDFSWAHANVNVKHYEKGQTIETDDQDLIEVSVREKWASKARGASAEAQAETASDQPSGEEAAAETATTAGEPNKSE